MKRAVTTAVLLILVAVPAVAQMYVVRRPITGGGTPSVENGMFQMIARATTSATAQCGAGTYASTSLCGSVADLPVPIAIRVTAVYIACGANPSSSLAWSLRLNDTSNTSLCNIPTSGNPECSATGLSLDVAAGDRLSVYETTSLTGTVDCRFGVAYQASGGGAETDAIVIGGATAGNLTDVTRYCGPFSGTTAGGNDWGCVSGVLVPWLMPTTGTLTAVSIATGSNLSAGATSTYTMTQRDTGGSDTAITLTDTVQLSDSVSSDSSTCSSGCSVTAGNRWFITNVVSGTSGSKYRRWGMAFDGVGAILSGGDATVEAATRYWMPMGDSATETDIAWPVPKAGTIKNLRVWADSSFTNNPTITLRKGTYGSMSDTAMTCTTASGKCTDTSNTVSVAAGDYIDFSIVKSGSNEGRNTRITVEIAP